MPNPDKAFFDRADEFLELANHQCSAAEPGTVSASLLYATARFNTFVVANTTKSLADFSANKEEAVRYYINQYEMMLRDKLDDYERNFNKYTNCQQLPNKSL